MTAQQACAETNDSSTVQRQDFEQTAAWWKRESSTKPTHVHSVTKQHLHSLANQASLLHSAQHRLLCSVWHESYAQQLNPPVGSAGAERDVCATTQAEAVSAWDGRRGSLRSTTLSVTCHTSVAHLVQRTACSVQQGMQALARSCTQLQTQHVADCHGKHTCSVRNIEMTSPPNSAATTHSTAAPCARFMLDANLPCIPHSGARPARKRMTLSSPGYTCCLP